MTYPRSLLVPMLGLGLAAAALAFFYSPLGLRPFVEATPLADLACAFEPGQRLDAGEIVVPPRVGGGAGVSGCRFWLPADRRLYLEIAIDSGAGGAVEVYSPSAEPSTGAGERRALIPAGRGSYRFPFEPIAASDFVTLRLLTDADQPLVVSRLTLFEVGPSFRWALSSAWVLLVIAVWLLAGSGRRSGQAIALFCLAFVIYRQFDLPAQDNSTDNELYVPTALSLLADGDMDLRDLDSMRRVGRGGYRIVRHEGAIYHRYPPGTPLLSLPLVAVAHSLLAVPGDPPSEWSAVADFVADFWAAASVALVLLLAMTLGAGARTAILVSLFYAFATPHFPTHAGGLWSHNLSTVLLLLSLWLLAARNGRWAWLSGLVLGLAFVTRPTAALMLPFVVFGLIAGRSSGGGPAQGRIGRAALCLGLFGATLALFGAWSLSTFGNVLPPYLLEHAGMLSASRFAGAFLGLLFSPNRGLFVFCPLFLLSIWGGVLTLRQQRFGEPSTLLPAFCAAYVLCVSSFEVWWGGGSYGPRLLAETFPFLALLWVPAIAELRKAAHAKRQVLVAPVLALVAVAALWSGFAAYRGATAEGTRSWNRWPRRVDRNPSRLWDWNDLQILRADRATSDGQSGGRSNPRQ